MTYRIVLVGLLLCLVPSLGTAGEEMSPEAEEVAATLNRLNKASDEKDIDGVMALVAPDAVFMGTGPGERWEGEEVIREAYGQFFASSDKEVAELTWRKVGVHGDIAWAAGMLNVTSYLRNYKKQFPLNVSVVLVKQDDGVWRIVQYHHSNPTSADPE